MIIKNKFKDKRRIQIKKYILEKEKRDVKWNFQEFEALLNSKSCEKITNFINYKKEKKKDKTPIIYFIKSKDDNDYKLLNQLSLLRKKIILLYCI